MLGLKHALDADHLAAVSTMAAERRSLLDSSLIGILWGAGHTAALMIAGLLVIFLHLQIGERTSKALEFCVGVMLIVLGASALRRLARSRKIHMHAHEHHGFWHVHPHLHGRNDDAPHRHHGLASGVRPVLVGMMHGLAGSAALTLLVLATIPNPALGLIYIMVFGVGSIGGMMIMSTLFALPSKLTSRRFTRANVAVRMITGVFSTGFGLVMVYDIGVNHLLR